MPLLNNGRDPYNTAAIQRAKVSGVRFTHQYEIVRNVRELPTALVKWARETLPDGEYVAQYQLCRDAWIFASVGHDGKRRTIKTLDVEWSA